jgi:3-methylcrotonyl-CoA carboxylase alpha subunit
MSQAALAFARAIGYRSAGTAEFMLDDGDFHFLELNGRIQVEHPVTEEITGQDLVEWQLRIASGEPLPLGQGALEINGWAMEARLYAEDPATGFLPSIGPLTDFDLNDGMIRSDSGVEEGGEVSPFYDPMIAKLIAHGEDRDDAIERLSDALLGSVVWPVRTNGAFLLKALADPDFVGARLDTGLIARKGDAWLPAKLPREDVLRGAAWRLIESAPGELPRLPGFRLNGPQRLATVLDVQGTRVPVDFVEPAENWYMRHIDDRVMVNEEGQTFAIRLARFDGSGAGSAGDGAILAPMPGRVTAVEVAAGDTVAKGQRLVTLEAMKMEHGLSAPFDGTIAELNVTQGSQVSEGTLLVKVEKGAD